MFFTTLLLCRLFVEEPFCFIKLKINKVGIRVCVANRATNRSSWILLHYYCGITAVVDSWPVLTKKSNLSETTQHLSSSFETRSMSRTSTQIQPVYTTTLEFLSKKRTMRYPIATYLSPVRWAALAAMNPSGQQGRESIRGISFPLLLPCTFPFSSSPVCRSLPRNPPPLHTCTSTTS